MISSVSSRFPFQGAIGGRQIAAFTLIEVVVAVGIIGFAMAAIIGSLASALDTQKQATDQARAAQLLGSATSAIWGVRKTASGYGFLPPLENVDVASAESRFGLTEQGELIAENDNSRTRRASVVILQPSPKAGVQSRPVHISVAWPGAARWKNGKWDEKARGSMESVIFFNLPGN